MDSYQKINFIIYTSGYIFPQKEKTKTKTKLISDMQLGEIGSNWRKASR